MDSNLNLTIGVKGQIKANAQAMPLMEGYLKIGGIAGANLPFGIVGSAAPADLTKIVAGCPTGNVPRGIVVYDDAIAQNAPAHASSYIQGLPCAVINHGALVLESWTSTAAGAAAPTIGSKVIFNNTTGVIEFVPEATAVPSGWTQMTNVSVRDVTADGVVLFIA